MSSHLPRLFVELENYQEGLSIPEGRRVRVRMAYFTEENFVGRVISGYRADKCLLTEVAAKALLMAQERLLPLGRSLVVFDCYRPQKAVSEFVEWCHDEEDTRTKSEYYPDIARKRDLLRLGYIASRSGHSRGSTVDVGLLSLEDETLVDMGSRFDFFGEISHTDSRNISAPQRLNRTQLLNAFSGTGFKNYSKEWWHFTLQNEPYRDTYFDFDVE